MLPILFDALSILFIVAALSAVALVFTKKISFFGGVFVTTGALVAAAVTGMYSFKVIYGVDVVTAALDGFFKALEEALHAFSQENAGGFWGSLTLENLSLLKEMYKAVFPSLLILNILFFSYAFYMVVKLVLKLFRVPVHAYPKFSQLYLKKSAAFMLAACYVIPFFVNNTVYAAVFSNIGIIIFGVASLCGLSIVDFHLRQKIRNSFFRLLVYTSAFFILASGFGIVMVCLGFTAIADSFFNFRNLKPREVKRNG
ncbi:MAG: DUF2232 domain-containing protein [Eubacteriales bacterium]|jgi:hypothetical protein|nr:DUF2232 domain-containing protein [Eubacteriales bacterium]